jgi:hypothetical protein
MIRWLLTLCLLQVSLALPCGAQSSDANASGQSTTAKPEPTSNATPSAPKKVWTNDDLSGANGKASAVRERSNQKYPLTKTADPATVERIRKDLQKLQGQVEDIKKQVATYKEFQKGEPVFTNGYELNKGVNRVPVEQQMVVLEKKKKDLETQIDALYEEARKKGIDPGLLR